MATRLFDGTTLTFAGSPAGNLVGLSYSTGGQWQDVTIPSDLNKLFEVASQPELTVKAKFKQCHSLVYGAKGALAIVFSNGFSKTCPGDWQVGPANLDAEQGSDWKSDCEFRPTIA